MPVESDCHVSLSSQAGSYQEVGKVTGEGLIKGHAYAITDTVKVSVAQGGLYRLPYRNMAVLEHSNQMILVRQMLDFDVIFPHLCISGAERFS